ncbi:MAG: HPP family protein [Chloroflexales bacterium]
MQHTPLIITQPTLPNMQSLGSRPPQRERVLQSLLTVVVMGLALLLLKWLNLTTVASLAGTACNLFASPHVKVSRPRNVVFGYTIGIVVGLFGGLAVEYLGMVPACALATGLAVFLMVQTDSLHPPAVASTLGIATASVPLLSAVSLILSVAPLVLVHQIFKPYLRDVL